jgi:hypothetical protein
VSCSREILFSILEFSCWLLQAWLSCHVLIFVFTFAFPWMPLLTRSINSSRIRHCLVDTPSRL